MNNAKNTSKIFGKKIRVARINKGYKQLELAKLIGVSANYISLIEAGKKTPSLQTALSLADTLSVSIGELLEEDHILYDLRELTKKYDLDALIQGLQHLKMLGH